MKALIKQLSELLILLGLVILLFAAGRAIFLFTHNTLFEDFGSLDLLTVFYKGFIYDFWITILLNMLFIFLYVWPAKIYNSIFYQSILKVLFFIVNAAALFLNLLDVRAFTSVGHRLRAYEFRHELGHFFREFSDEELNELISRYLSLTIFFIAFALILWFSLRFIKTRGTEIKNLQFARRTAAFLTLGVFVGLFSANYFDKEDWLSKLYSRADRKLVPLIMNNPYLLLRSTNCNTLSDEDDWEFDTYESQKQYSSLNGSVPEHIKLVIFENSDYGFFFLDSVFADKDFENIAFSGLKTSHENIFKILDETLLSFPGIFEYHFYQSIYSLNRFENLIGLLKKAEYSVIVSSYGYDEKIIQIISHFYGFDNEKDSLNLAAKTFELVLINNIGNLDIGANKIISDLTRISDSKNTMIISIDNGNFKQSVNQVGLSKNIKIYTTFKLPILEQVNNRASQLLDIKPTILHLLNYQEPFISYGSSLFSSEERIILYCESINNFKLLKDTILLINSENETTSLNLLRKGLFSHEDYKDSLAVERIVLENKLHSILHDYNQRLLNNELQ